MHAGIPQPPQDQAPPKQTPLEQTPPHGADTSPQDQAPPEQTPPRTRHPPPAQCMLGDTVNKWTVCILLECNLVSFLFIMHIVVVFSALLLNSIMSAFKPEYIASRAIEFTEMIKQCEETGFPKVNTASNNGRKASPR